MSQKSFFKTDFLLFFPLVAIKAAATTFIWHNHRQKPSSTTTTNLIMKYNRPYYERVLVCVFSKKGTWTGKGPGTLGEVRGIFHKTKPMCSSKAFVSVDFINLPRKIRMIFKKGVKPSLNIHRLSRVRIMRSQFAICKAFWQFANEFLHFFWKLRIAKIKYFMNFQSHSLN